MAAPTNVYVESNSIATATLYWTAGGTAAVEVYRSTDGVSYAEITAPSGTLLRPSDGSGTFVDTSVAVATRYWYKLSNDLGVSFSSVVTVVTQTCPVPQGTPTELILPRFSDEVKHTIELNNMAERIEQVLQGRVLNSEECIVCSTNGAVVIDCTDGCKNFVVIADEDINSITINGCNTEEFNIAMIIPPNVTRRISGFPAGFGFGGDEGRQMPLVTGSAGATFSIGNKKNGDFFASGRNGYNPSSAGGSSSSKGNGLSKGGAAGGGGGGSGCTCTPLNGALTIKCCTNNCKLSCSSTKSLDLKVCGGRGPYSWSKTGNNKFKGKGDETTDTTTATGTAVTMRPPVNSGSGEAGTAYYKSIWGDNCGHAHAGGVTVTAFGCNDVFIAQVIDAVTNIECGFVDSTCGCSEHVGHGSTAGSCGGVVSCGFECASGTESVCAQANGGVDDKRSAGMIAAGCNPCGINAYNATVSVTDANGVVVTKILKA